MAALRYCLSGTFVLNIWRKIIMEDLNFEIDDILSPEEAAQMFNEQEAQKPEEEKETAEETTQPAEEKGQDPAPEKVGEEENNDDGKNAISPDEDGSSPNPYSSIAKALGADGILTGFEEKELEEVKTPEDFAELIDKFVESKLDEKQKRINDALSNGVEPDIVRQHEATLEYLGGITEEAITAEGEDADNLRRQLIFNDLLRRGYSEDKARKELEKSFTANTDVEDAKDALEALKNYYQREYQALQDDAKKKADEFRKAQKKQSDDFRKMVLEDEMKLGDTKIDKRTAQKIYDSVTKPVFKDPDTGRLLTEVQKFQKEHPLEFIKQLGMWFVLTEGGKNMDGFTKEKVRQEKYKGIKELERKINSTSLNADGSLRYASGRSEGGDTLLKGDWDVVM